MTLSTVEKTALNKLSVTVTEVAVGYNGLTADVPVGDRIADAGTSGTLTLAAATNTVVLNTDVKAGDQIFVQAQDTAGSALATVFVDPANIVPGVSFRVDHAAAAGTEVFAFLISR